MFRIICFCCWIQGLVLKKLFLYLHSSKALPFIKFPVGVNHSFLVGYDVCFVIKRSQEMITEGKCMLSTSSMLYWNTICNLRNITYSNAKYKVTGGSSCLLLHLFTNNHYFKRKFPTSKLASDCQLLYLKSMLNGWYA